MIDKSAKNTIESLDLGKGSVVVILPGNWTTSRPFDSIARKLSKNHRVVVPELFRGGSVFSQPALYIQDYARALYDFLIQKKISTIALVGTSFGGLIASEFALKHPGMVRKLLLVNTLPPASGLRFGVSESLAAYLKVFWRNIISKNNWRIMLRLFKDSTGNGLFKHPAQFILDGFIAVSATGGLARPASIPTKLLLANQDDFLPLDRISADILRHYTHEIIPGDHAWFFTNEDLFVEKINDFLSKSV